MPKGLVTMLYVLSCRSVDRDCDAQRSGDGAVFRLPGSRRALHVLCLLAPLEARVLRPLCAHDNRL